MAVPNVNQITSTLRMMGDQQLQQYAAMHKNDPYILPMAIAESNARKQMRAQSQAQAMGQPQPKVADADIAAMAPQAPQAPQPPQLPEQQGIGALPAQNIQHMADGGIAGYAGGGSDESLAYDNEPVMRMAGGGIAHFAGPANQLVGGVAGDIPGYVPSATNFMPQAGAAEDLPLLQRKTREAAEAVRDGTATPQQKALVGWATRLGFGTPDLGKQETGSVFTPGSTSGFATSSPITATGVVPEKTEKEKSKAKQNPDGIKTLAAKQQQITAPAADSDYMAQAKGFKVATPEELAAQAKAMSTGTNEEMEAAYKPYRQQIEEEREALKGKKESNVGSALLRAGLGMLAGKSQHAFQNIGEGAIQGLNAYEEAQKADDMARKGLMQSDMLMMQAQRAERSGNHRDAVALINQSRQEKQAGLANLMQAQQIKQTGEYQQGSLANQRAQIAQAGALGQARLDLMKEQYGQNSKAMAEYTKIQTKVMSELKNNPTWLAADEAGKAKIARDELNRQIFNNPFLSSLQFARQASPSGKVYSLDDET